MKNAKIGDQVKIEIGPETYEGILMENPDQNTIMIKLSSGYNIGLLKKKITKISILKAGGLEKPKAGDSVHLPVNKDLKTISILHTGGTIASKVDYATGAVTSRFTPEEIIGMFPEIKKIVNINSRLMGNMMSDDMRFAHYNIMAREIEKEISKGVDGIIITQGTDTMHYTSAALSFILEDLPIPLIIVGAQRSSDRGSSDAAMNLICACKFIADTNFAEVGVCMHKNASDDICIIIPGTKARKMHTSRRDAFKAVNSEPWAEIDYAKLKIMNMRDSYRKREERKLNIKPIKEKLKIGMAFAHPNMFASELESYNDFDGLILMGTGLGHFPITKIDEYTTENKKIFTTIKKLSAKMPIVMSPQTIFGRIQMNVYSPGRLLQEIGVMGNYTDMTPETTFIKLAWLLSNHPKEVKGLMGKDMRGEIKPRTPSES